MKLTKIDEKNIYYFLGLIEKQWMGKNNNQLFVGGIDDKDKAVCAACFEVSDLNATLLYIATEPENQRKGYARELLSGFNTLIENTLVKCVSAFIYENEEEAGDLSAVNNLLLSCGFEEEKTNVTRLEYKLLDFEKTVFNHTKVEGEIKKCYQLTLEEEKELLDIYEDYEDKFSVYLTKNNDIKAFIHITDIEGAVVVDAVYSSDNNLASLEALYEVAYKNVCEVYKNDISVYIDVMEERLKAYAVKIIGKEPKETYEAKCYCFRLNGGR